MFVENIISIIIVAQDCDLQKDFPEKAAYVRGPMKQLVTNDKFTSMRKQYGIYRHKWQNNNPKLLAEIAIEGIRTSVP